MNKLEKKQKRLFFPNKEEYKGGGYHCFYECPFCGIEIVANFKYFYDYDDKIGKLINGPLKYKEDLTCPECGNSINYSEDYFIDIYQKRKTYDLYFLGKYYRSDLNDIPIDASIDYISGRLLCSSALNSNDYYYKIGDRTPQLYLLSWEDLQALSNDERKQYIRISPFFIHNDPFLDASGEKSLDENFEYLRYKRLHPRELAVESFVCDYINTVDNSYSNSIKDQPKSEISATIKGDVEKLKQYIENLINIETALFSLKERLMCIEKERLPYLIRIEAQKSIATKGLQQQLEKDKEALTKPFQAKAYSKNKPEPPHEPSKPVLKTPGLFNKKKVQADNEALNKEYEILKKDYAKKLQRYKEQLSLYEKEKERDIQQQKINFEKEQSLLRRNIEDIERKIAECANQLPDTPEKAKKNLLDEEIQSAYEAIQTLIKGKYELYSYNIIYGKYRNFMALSMFYEYLVSGRCDSLEGGNGAYNIYESEVRSNQIISQLSEALKALETIKTNQYMTYSQLTSVNLGLEHLNSSTEAALASLTSVKHIADNSAVAAYHAERTAYYTEKNAELTRALAFMTALK